MHENKNGLVGQLWITLFVVICFALFAVNFAHAYSYSDYYGWDEDDQDYERENDWRDEDDDELEYYDHRTGQMETIPETDPYCYPVSYGRHRASSPISVMMPLFIIFFMLLPWLAFALGRGDDG